MTHAIWVPLLTAAGMLVMLGSTAARGQEGDGLAQAKALIQQHEGRVRPLEKALWLAAWQADISGKDADFRAKEAAQNALDAALSDAAVFARLKALRGRLGALAGADGLVARQIELLYLQYLEKQLDPSLLAAMTAKASKATQAFNTYRAAVNGEALKASDVARVLKTSRDSAYRKQVWEASKGVGSVVEKDLKELVGLRNQAARKLGFSDFFDMQLQLAEVSKPQIVRLFDELYELTRQPFQAAKADIDQRLAKDYGIKVEELRPWHYHDVFFQESPAVYSANFDPCYAKADLIKLSRDFYAGIGLPVDGVLARSDLFEKPGKYPHAQCCDMDLEGDVRVMANIVPDEYWMGTMLHELGHSVYCAPNIPPSLPYVLRSPAHAFTTEGLAMMMERLSKRVDWMQAMGLTVPDAEPLAEAGKRMSRNHLLIFSAWSQVMVRFEMSMYENPDQDLNRLWWDLVEKYQLLHRPEGRNAPDYASKIHIVSSPVYYYSYTMGEMFASQLHRAILRQALKSGPDGLYNGHREVGEFLKLRVFAPGRTMKWDEMVKYATGEALSAKAFADDLR